MADGENGTEENGKTEEAHFAAGTADGAGNSSKEPEVQVVVPSSSRKRNMLFERSNGSIFYPRYDSPLLENYFLECAFPESRHRLRFTLVFMAVVGLVWAIFARAAGVNEANIYLGLGLALTVVCLIIFGLTFLNFFQAQYQVISVVWTVLAIVLILSMFAITPSGLSYVVMVALCLKMLLIIYTVVPTPFFVCIILAVLLSIIFEVLMCVRYNFHYFMGTRILVQLSIHILGMHLHLMSQVRRRSTFIKLCQSARAKKEIKVEQKANREMIRSLMPDKVANEVMQGEESKKQRRREEMGSDCGSDEEESDSEMSESASESESEDVEQPSPDDLSNKQNVVTFRKFHVSQMENVSILYADIVGFTKMSSHKTAPHLVFLLNDLFGRFDKLCELNGNEKIATLGDCYYCVAGCPDSVENHAERCVEMGRSMCLAIQQFDRDHSEEVNMRVGVHTGMVICGIVGTRRFKFDVWSNDVNLANEMESSGQAGKVHISESTFKFVEELYEVENGEPVPDIRKLKFLIEYFDEKQKCYAIKHTQDEAEIQTYFIVSRKDGKPPINLEDNQESVVITEVEKDGAGDEAAGLTEKKEEGKEEGEGEGRRESSDSALVDDMRAEKQTEVFYFPPLSPISLNFTERRIERKYRNLGVRPVKRPPTVTTLSTPRVTPLADSLAFLLLLLLTTVACFAAGQGQVAAQAGVLVVALLLSAVLLVPLLVDRCASPGPAFLAFYARFFAWYPRNSLGALLLCLPVFTVLATLMVCALRAEPVYTYGFAILLLLAVSVFTLFTMYSFWTKLLTSLLMVLLGIILVALSPRSLCRDGSSCLAGYDPNVTAPVLVLDRPACNVTEVAPVFAQAWMMFCWEFAVAILLLLFFISFLNRKFDISYRLSFNCDQAALKEKSKISNAKKQADWLLQNIIPHYIIDDLKKTQKYSQHMTDVGVIFATLSNFSQFYDEQFQGGREMLRVLNEIFADFEHLLTLPKYKDVEKIKTIGACFMAASGLNAIDRKKNANSNNKDRHLYMLMDFCIDLLLTIDEFNKQIFNFDFELKIGYNIGEVTAGVIGTTKLLYDIWGNTVNVASRMYSTGEKGRIQVPKDIAERMSDVYEFEYRDVIEVKGKGPMETYLLVKKKEA